jgi:hypothetical protein
MKQHDSSKKIYEVITQKEDDDLLIPIPPDLLRALGWKEGDTIDFDIDDKGRYILNKANPE